MKKTNIFFILLTLLISSQGYAQLTGTKTIPGDYASIGAAVTDLNTAGVGSGGVTFNIAAGHTENVTDAILVTATGTQTNPIVFQKSGTGANPKITRTDVGTLATTTLGGQGDAVIIIQGSDYLTFRGIDVASNDAGIEYGYYLRKASVTDGCKFVTIENAAITMTKGTSNYVAGIYSSNNDAASLVSSATGITVTSVDGRNESVTIRGNVIGGVFTGILLRGFNHTVTPYDFYDQSFVIGDQTAGNTIQNFAGNAASTAYGVYLIYHNNASVSYNTINNTADGGTGATAGLYGVFNSTGTTSVFTANNNTVNVTTSATTGLLHGISTSSTGNLTLNNNNVTLNSTATTSGVFGYLFNSSGAAASLVTISGNTFNGSTIQTTGATYLIYNNSSQVTPGVTNVHNNSTSGVITRSGASGSFYCYYNNGSPTGTENVYNNTFSDVVLAGTAAFDGVLSTTGSSHTHNVYNNIVRDITGGTGTMRGIHLTLAARTAYDNKVYNLTGGGTVTGISSGSGSAAIYRNSVYNLTSNSVATTAGLVNGIAISGSNVSYFVYNNFISDLKAPTAAAVDAIRGISSTTTTATTMVGLYYNTIYLNASSTGANFGTSGIFHTYSATATSAALDMRNNIVVNNSTPVGTGSTVAFRRSAATSLLNYSELSNNNNFYAGTPGVANLIFFDGTNADQTLADFKTRVAPREGASVSVSPSFVNATTPPYNLHIDTTVISPIEGGGQPITSPLAITADFDQDTRNSNSPDIGADEFNGAVPAIAIYGISPASKDFGNLQIGTSSPYTTFNVSNTGGANLTVNAPSTFGADISSFEIVDTNTYPKVLGTGTGLSFAVRFSPATTGAKLAGLILTHSATGSPDTVELSGTGVDYRITSFPYSQGFEDGVVPPAGWSNPGNYWQRSTESKSGTYAAGASYNYSAVNQAMLISPPINLPANAKITFWWKDDDPTFGSNLTQNEAREKGISPEVVGQDTTFFEISTDDGATWTTLKFLSAPASQAAYVEEVIDLTPYAGNNRIIRWRDKTNASGSAWGILVDDIVIEEVPQITMDWHNLQWPATANIVAGNSVDVYTQGWENNVTPNPGPDTNITVWIGVSNANTNPNTWLTWVPAVFNTQQGNNDEYMAAIGANLAPGTYYYASRWQLQNGPYTYGGYSTNGGGFWDGTANVSGVLTVTPYSVSTLPYTEGFESTTFPPLGWSVVNVNNDPKTWIGVTTAPNSGTRNASYPYSGTLDANDWLISPGIALEAGKTYRVVYYYRAASASFPEKMKLAVGSAPVPDSLYTVLADHSNIVNITYNNNMVLIQAQMSGMYYFGFHAYSIADQFNLYLDDVAIVEVPPVDYAVAEIKQLNAVPTFPSEAVNGLVKGEEEIALNPTMLGTGVASGLVNSTNIIYGNNTYTDNGLQVVGQGPTPMNVQSNVPVSLDAYIANAGLTNVPYTLNYSIAGVQFNPIERAGVAPGTVDTVNVGATVLNRGTVSTIVTVTAAGDTINSFNNMGANHKTLVYPDSAIRMRYDNGPNTPNTFIGFSTNNISLWGAVRFTAQANVKLTNVDAFYRTEASSDSITVGIWGPGATTTAPGPLLYVKKFGGDNYLSAGGAYVTLPLGDDAPGFQAGTDYWISLMFNSEILFPLGAHNSPLTTPGRSYLSQDTGKTWVPLIVTTERAWFIRSVGVAWQLPALTTSWEKSKYKSNLPSWFSPSGSTERGFGYGVVGGNQRLYVVSRNGGLNVRVVNAITGNDAGALDVTGIAGGTFPLNDAGVTMDGKIIAANLRTTALDTFRVYMWNDEASAPVKVVDYAPAHLVRLGDKITVVGDFSANTAEIWAASATAGVGKVYVWKMTGGAFNALPDSITLSDGAAGGSAAVGPIPGGGFYWNSGGNSAKRYAADGTLLGTVPGTVVATGTNAIRYVGSKADVEYFATYQYGAGNENGRVVGVPAGDFASAFTYGITPSMGNNSNAGGTGDLEVRRNPDGTVDVFVLGTNNGFGLYHTTAEVPVELTSFVAAISGSDVVLNWSTASEVNNSGFSIERKAAGESFTAVSFIEGKGNTAELSRYTYTDKNVTPGVYTYRLKQIDFDGTFSYSAEVEVNVEIPGVFELAQNYPNPFNPSTTIKFALPKDANVTLSVYSVLGEKVATLINGSLKAGNHVVNFDATKLATGLYIYKLEAGEFSATKKMMFLK